MENQARLIRAEINILGMTVFNDSVVTVYYEFPYRTKNNDRRWTKQVYWWDCAKTKSNMAMYKELYAVVQGLREILEA